MKIINFESSWKDSKAADNKISHILEVNHFCTPCAYGDMDPTFEDDHFVCAP